jgi:nanoRNase/pAp phosphatase (c-di-AMP/oligoRNAs hydrolase)
MIRLLGQVLVPFSDIDPAKFNRIVIVDSQPSHHKLMEPLKPDVIIDHHPQSNNGAPLADIRPKYGATATIMIEYLRAARIKPSTKLATALYHGIKTDTNEFKGPFLVEDVKAFQYIFRYVNIHLASKF